MVGGVTQRNLDSIAREEVQREPAGASVCVFDADHSVAGFEDGEKCIADGSHAGGETGGSFGSLQGSHLFFKYLDGGVGVSAVDVTFRFAQSHLFPGIQILIVIPALNSEVG